MQRVVVISYRRFGATPKSHPQGSWIVEPEGWAYRLSRNVAKNYRYSLCNKTEVRSSHLLRDGSLKSRIEDRLFGYGRRLSGNKFQKFKIRLNFHLQERASSVC